MTSRYGRRKTEFKLKDPIGKLIRMIVAAIVTPVEKENQLLREEVLHHAKTEVDPKIETETGLGIETGIDLGISPEIDHGTDHAIDHEIGIEGNYIPLKF